MKPGTSFGATNEIGYSVVENKLTPHDLMATILRRLGLDPLKRRYPHSGLLARIIGPTDNAIVPKELRA